jgi:hypothetical protein
VAVFASCALSILSIYVIAVTCLVIVWNIPQGKRCVAWSAGALFTICPLLIPANEVIARALVSVLCADAWFKSVDLARLLSRRRATAPSFLQCLEFLIPFPTFVAVFDDRKRRDSMTIEAIDLWRVAIGGSLVIIEIWVLDRLFEVPALKSSFILDHIVKLLLFVATTESLSQLMLGVERLAGFDTTPIIRRAFLSQTSENSGAATTREFTGGCNTTCFYPAGE